MLPVLCFTLENKANMLLLKTAPRPYMSGAHKILVLVFAIGIYIGACVTTSLTNRTNLIIM